MLVATFCLILIAIVAGHVAGLTRTLSGCLAIATVAAILLATGHNPGHLTTPQGWALLTWFAGCSGLLLHEGQRRLATLTTQRRGYIFDVFGLRLAVAWAPVAA